MASSIQFCFRPVMPLPVVIAKPLFYCLACLVSVFAAFLAVLFSCLVVSCPVLVTRQETAKDGETAVF
jgi:hypothetical protein